LEEAIDHMKLAVRREPENAGYRSTLGTMLEKAGDTENAVTNYFQALELDPADDPAYAGLQRTYVRSRVPGREAFVPGEHFPKLKNNAVFYNNLSLVYAREKKLAEAETCLRRALEINPRSAKSLNNLGMVRVQEKRFAEAAGFFAEALAIDPGYERARLNLGLALVKQGKMGEAIPHFREAARRNPKSEEAARYLKRAETGSAS
jgi:Flp pilus assembly protein TadD